MTVTLTGTTSAGVALVPMTTTSAANGTYSFAGLAPGVYSVADATPAGYMAESGDVGAVTLTTGGASTVGTSGLGSVSGIVLNSNAAAANYNFGQYKPATITGTVYVDANANDTLDAGDTGLAGITVTLLNSSGATVATTTSASNGTYSFAGVTPGVYSIQEGSTPGYNRENANPGTSGGTPWWGAITGFNLTSGANDTGNNFGQYVPATLSGTVYVDATGVGLTTANVPPAGSGDTPEAGVTINLYNSSGTYLASTVSAADGSYSFSGYPIGTYYIGETVPAGYSQTGPNALYYGVTTTATAPNSTGDNFSNYMQCNMAGLSGITYTITTPRRRLQDRHRPPRQHRPG